MLASLVRVWFSMSPDSLTHFQERRLTRGHKGPGCHPWSWSSGPAPVLSRRVGGHGGQSALPLGWAGPAGRGCRSRQSAASLGAGSSPWHRVLCGCSSTGAGTLWCVARRPLSQAILSRGRGQPAGALCRGVSWLLLRLLGGPRAGLLCPMRRQRASSVPAFSSLFPGRPSHSCFRR